MCKTGRRALLKKISNAFRSSYNSVSRHLFHFFGQELITLGLGRITQTNKPDEWQLLIDIEATSQNTGEGLTEGQQQLPVDD